MRNLTERLPRDLLKWTAAGFALVATATAEYEIARAIGMNEWIAAAVPGALDAYVVRALRTHREVLTSVVAMVGVNAASHLVTAGILPVEWPLITAVSAIAPLVLWRVHALGTPGETRRHVLWGLPWRARTVEHTSTEPEHTEHGRAPDNPEPPGTREHPEGCVHGHVECVGERACTVYRSVHAIENDASTPELDVPDWVNPASTAEHIACTECGAMFPGVPDMEAHQKWAGHGVLGRVHAPYADHVHVEHTDPGPVLLPFLPSTQPVKARHLEVVPDPGELDDRDGVTGYVDETVHAPDPVCENCGHAGHGEHRHDGRSWAADALRDCPLCSCAQELREMCGYCAETEHTPFACPCTDGNPAACPVHEIEHTASTRTADDWNREHVSTGTLTPEDTEHMERARELFHTIGGMPPFRALKHGTPGMGTDRAKRIRAALEIENKGTD